MSSNKLRKYLAYYRKTLSDDPENIEARLRLAALFREMERPTHAIEEYGTAAKLLASDGLPLEAIAACKAILELEPSHQETQLFLARLYAQVPEATGDSVRVAKPVDSDSSTSSGAGGGIVERNSSHRLGDGDEGAITLDQPKTVRSEVPGQTGSSPAEANAARPAETSQPAGESETDHREVTRRASRDELDIEATRPESTKMQRPAEQEVLRDRATPEQDRQTIELGVFDMDSLGLDERSTGEWQDLDFLDEVDEPDTVEIEVDESAGRGAGPNGRGGEREFRVSALPRIPLFSQLPRKVFVEVLDAMELKRIPAGTQVLRAGDPAGCLYVIVSGQVRIEKDVLDGRPVELATLGEGEVFGEFRLLTGKGGWAHVVAESELELLVIRDEVVYEIGRKYPKLWQVMWSFYYRRMLNHAMASSELFRMLSREERELVCRHFELEEVPAGETLFARGDAVDDLSLIVRGSVSIEVPDDGRQRVVDTLEEGSFVGVSPTAREVPATANALARTDVVVYRMSGSIFRELMYGLPEVAEAVREMIRTRQSRTPDLNSDPSMSEWV